MKTLFDTTLEQVTRLHQNHEAIRDFGNFPDDFEWQDLSPYLIDGANLMVKDQTLGTKSYSALRDAFIAPWQHVNWRETYRDTNIGENFLSRFACYELFGHEGHFKTEKMRGFLLYSDADLYYPWHHHPAEELYFIIAGEASFATEGNEPKLLKSGDTVFHAENQPHNMQTHECGVLAYVLWRGEMGITPVLTDRLNH